VLGEIKVDWGEDDWHCGLLGSMDQGVAFSGLPDI